MDWMDSHLIWALPERSPHKGAPPPFMGSWPMCMGRGGSGAPGLEFPPSRWPPPLGGPTCPGPRLLPGLEEGLVLPLSPYIRRPL